MQPRTGATPAGARAASSWRAFRLDEMQHPTEHRVAPFDRASDVDDAGMPQLVGKDIHDAPERLVVERTEGVIDENPRWHLQHNAGEGEVQLFVERELPIPSVIDIEQRQ